MQLVMWLFQFSVIVMAAILASSAQAQECDSMNIVDMEVPQKRSGYVSYGVRSVPIMTREDVHYAINSSKAGYGTIAESGIVLTKGAKATLKFDFTMKAVTSNMVDSQDHYFENSLNETEKESYHAMKQSYHGGLTIPMLSWIGINLGADVTKEDMDRSAAHTRNYNELSQDVQNVMNTTTKQTIRIKGSLQAEGVSMVPTTVYAYIKVAQVKLNDGTTQTVVTSDGDDLAAGTKDGSQVPSDSGKLDVIPLADYVAP